MTATWLRPRMAFLALVLAFGLATSPRPRTAPAQEAPPWPTAGWTSASPGSVGIDADAFAVLDADIRRGVYGHIDRMLVVKAGRLAIDEQYAQDYRAISRGRRGPLGCGWGCDDPARLHDFNYYHPDYHPYYQGRQVHSLQSVTKSIASTVIGVALGGGEIDSLDQPWLDFFDDRDLSGIDPRLRRATLVDLLTMRSGIEWHETDRPFDDTNTTLQLEGSDDWIAFTLSQPMDAAPGEKWAYNSGGSHLMSGIIRAATGRFIDDYAREFLFDPLGITELFWKKTPQGYPDTEGGLYLRAKDLAKIGYLYLHDGMWEERRILPEGWVANATTRHARQVQGTWDYGLQWWITRQDGVDVWAARGFGGQVLYVIPDRDVIGVLNAWNVFGERVRPLASDFLVALARQPARR